MGGGGVGGGGGGGGVVDEGRRVLTSGLLDVDVTRIGV